MVMSAEEGIVAPEKRWMGVQPLRTNFRTNGCVFARDAVWLGGLEGP